MFIKSLRPLSRFHSLSYTIPPIKSKSTKNFHVVLGASLAFVTTQVLCEDSNENKVLSKAEFLDLLKKNLNDVRNTLKRTGKSTPNLSYHIENDPNATSVSTHIVEIAIMPNMDVIGLLGQWSLILSSTKDEKLHFVNTHSQSISDSPNYTLSFMSPNKSSSILIEQKTLSPLSISPFRRCAVALYKDGGFTERDVKYIVKGYSAAMSTTSSSTSTSTDSQTYGFHRVEDNLAKLFGNIDDEKEGSPSQRSRGQRTSTSTSKDDPVAQLRALGVEVYDKGSNNELTWESLAGYEHVKTSIEDTIINALQHPDVYDAIASRTRAAFTANCNRPKAVLFEGPPGTGKTLTARILAQRVNRPMVQLSVEQIVSKWYGDSEKKLAKIFDLCEELGGAVLFIDEVDALAASRDSSSGSSMHEATRRVLSVILQRLEGFKGSSTNLLVCATNRKQDLDAALLSRFDLSIRYDLPDLTTRQAVFSRYAKHLSVQDLSELAQSSQGMSCRDIRDVCSQTERAFASKVVRKEVSTGAMPGITQYRKYLDDRRSASGLVKGMDI